MANPKPRTEFLALGRGKRPKLNHKTVAMRMSTQTKEHLEKLAKEHNCYHGDKPWICGLLNKIAEGKLAIVPTSKKDY